MFKVGDRARVKASSVDTPRDVNNIGTVIRVDTSAFPYKLEFDNGRTNIFKRSEIRPLNKLERILK